MYLVNILKGMCDVYSLDSILLNSGGCDSRAEMTAGATLPRGRILQQGRDYHADEFSGSRDAVQEEIKMAVEDRCSLVPKQIHRWRFRATMIL